MIVYPTRHLWFSAENASGETIPAFAPCKVVAVQKATPGRLILSKPDRDDDPLVAFNGPAMIVDGGGGFATRHFPAIAYYDNTYGDPANNENLGTRAGSWKLHKGHEGFVAWGGVQDEHVFVQSDLICRQTTEGLYYGYYAYPPLRVGKHLLDCCPRYLIPDELHVTVSNTVAQNITYPVTYQTSGPYAYSWISDYVVQFTGCPNPAWPGLSSDPTFDVLLFAQFLRSCAVIIMQVFKFQPSGSLAEGPSWAGGSVDSLKSCRPLYLTGPLCYLSMALPSTSCPVGFFGFEPENSGCPGGFDTNGPKIEITL